MPSDTADGAQGKIDKSFNSVEYLLFDSLVHHLIEKGLLTKNDALRVVQIAAEVVRGRIHESASASERFESSLAMLERTYSSFEALPDGSAARRLSAENVHPLRAPLHRDPPQFPADDN